MYMQSKDSGVKVGERRGVGGQRRRMGRDEDKRVEQQCWRLLWAWYDVDFHSHVQSDEISTLTATKLVCLASRTVTMACTSSISFCFSSSSKCIYHLARRVLPARFWIKMKRICVCVCVREICVRSVCVCVRQVVYQYYQNIRRILTILWTNRLPTNQPTGRDDDKTTTDQS